jgi:hypothetical protein
MVRCNDNQIKPLKNDSTCSQKRFKATKKVGNGIELLSYGGIMTVVVNDRDKLLQIARHKDWHYGKCHEVISATGSNTFLMFTGSP